MQSSIVLVVQVLLCKTQLLITNTPYDIFNATFFRDHYIH